MSFDTTSFVSCSNDALFKHALDALIDVLNFLRVFLSSCGFDFGFLAGLSDETFFNNLNVASVSYFESGCFLLLDTFLTFVFR